MTTILLSLAPRVVIECAYGMASWPLHQGKFLRYFIKVDDNNMCLLYGKLSSKSHPFLAKVIETVVNNIRNRFTVVDVMNTMCPGPLDFDTLLSYDLLFTS